MEPLPMTVNNTIWTFKPGHLSLHLTQLIITINNGIVNLSRRGMKTFWNNTFWRIRVFFLNIPLGPARNSKIRICLITRQVFFAAFPHSCCVDLSVNLTKILGFLWFWLQKFIGQLWVCGPIHAHSEWFVMHLLLCKLIARKLGIKNDNNKGYEEVFLSSFFLSQKNKTC